MPTYQIKTVALVKMPNVITVTLPDGDPDPTLGFCVEYAKHQLAKLHGNDLSIVTVEGVEKLPEASTVQPLEGTINLTLGLNQ